EEGTLRLADGEERHAVVEDVEPGERLTFWWWAGDEPPTHVELTLEPAVGGTRVVVVESGYAAGPVMFAGAAAMGPLVLAGAATGVGVTDAASPRGVAGGAASPGVAGAPPSLGIACAALPRLLAAGALVPA